MSEADVPPLPSTHSPTPPTHPQVAFVGEAEGAALSGQAGQIELVVAEGLEVFLPMAGLFDAAKEIERLGKQQAKLEKELAGLQARAAGCCCCFCTVDCTALWLGCRLVWQADCMPPPSPSLPLPSPLPAGAPDEQEVCG